MKNNKGFAISSVVYAMLVLFLGIILLIIGNLANRKATFDKEKNEILSRFNSNTLCTLVSGNLYEIGSKYECNLGNGVKTYFYALEDGDTTQLTEGRIAKTGEISLIMNMNIDSEGKGATTGNIVRWSSEGNNTNGPVTALEYLKNSTKNWTKLNQAQISMPSAEQIASASGQTFNSSSSDNISGLSSWLYENIDHVNSALEGYWTSTPIYSSGAWYVYYGGSLRYNGIMFGYGVRPVITIKKSQLGYPTTILCTAKENATNGNKAYGNYHYGDEYSCNLGDNEEKTFYVLENNDDTVSLIMNMNIDSNGKGTTSGNTVAWISKEDYIAAGGAEEEYGSLGNNGKGPITANNYLKNSTTNWTKLNQSQISMPTGEQIAKAVGDTEWNDENYTGTVLSGWLYENVNGIIAPYGYWTSTPDASSSSSAWNVYYRGSLNSYGFVVTGSNYGVRPVITIPKTQIKNLEPPVLCMAKSTVTNGNKAEGNYNYGDEYSCELGDNEEKTFYVLENNDNTVSLIMNMNIDSSGKGTMSGNTVAWCKSGDNNSCAADGVLEYLKNSTTSWTKLNQNQISMPTYDQIKNTYTKSMPTWLYENLNGSSAPYGYWTPSPDSSSSNAAWYVYSSGYLSIGHVGSGGGSGIGVRPVITIPKTQIKNLEPPVLCMAKSTVTNGNKAEGNYNYGDEYSCELGDNEEKTFYVLENNDNTVSLIMNMNIDSSGKGTTSGNTVAWLSKEDYIAAGGAEEEYGSLENSGKGPITANNYLKNSTASWTKLNESQISMPTGEQIAKAGGDTEWNGRNGTGTVLSGWLSENLNGWSSSAPYGYWTSTPNASNSYIAWLVHFDGKLNYISVDSGIIFGVRPVITIPKTQIKNLEPPYYVRQKIQ